MNDASKPSAGSKSKVTKKPSATKAPSARSKKATAKKQVSPAASKAATAMVTEHPEGVFARLTALREEMDNLFTSMTRNFGFPDIKIPSIEMPLRPSLVDVRFEVAESDKAVEVRAELPGLTEEDIEIKVSDGLLTIKGEKRDERDEKKKDYQVHECRYGSFSRSFRVPDSVLEDEINADLEKGILSVALPKRAIAKRGPKSIKLSTKS